MKNAVALGTFDGIHKGHLSVLDIPVGYNKIALIFTIPPKCVKKGEINLLLTPEEKKERLEKMGFEVKCLDFTQVEHLTPNEFLDHIKKEFNPELISCGFNYRFGYKGVGDTVALAEFCGENGIILRVANPVTQKGEVVSSSLIREMLKEGNVLDANSFLGYSFFFTAPVIRGDGRGKTLGFPTINQIYPKLKTPLKFGVYKTEITVDNETYSGITNIGFRPTFPVEFCLCETFIKDFKGDLYGKELKIELKEFIREEKKFQSQKDLKIQILKDMGV